MKEALRMARAVNDPSYPSLVTVGRVNFETVARNKAATLEKIRPSIQEAVHQGCDLVVFPELALNSWTECQKCAERRQPRARPLEQAEPVPGPATESVVKVARDLDIHVRFGMEERDPDTKETLYNSAVLIGPGGLIGIDRKVHFGIPLETDRFTPGDRLPVFETRLGPIGISICYDFYNNPERSRVLA